MVAFLPRTAQGLGLAFAVVTAYACGGAYVDELQRDERKIAALQADLDVAKKRIEDLKLQADPVPDMKPPFDSISKSDLKTHHPVRWNLQVTFDSFQGLPRGTDRLGLARSWEVAEARAGDVPMPPGSRWKCRFDHVDVRVTLLMREIRCSSDGWRTQVGDTANAPTGAATPVVGGVTLYEGGRFVGDVSIQPCMPGDRLSCPPSPELP